MTLTIEEFKLLRNFVYERLGIFFSEKKLFYFDKRIARRVRALGFDTPMDYYRYIKFGKDEEELKELTNLLTTNETYFFREMPHLTSFTEDTLPIITQENRLSRTLNIWSAGCSTGDEPYTLAMLTREKLPNLSAWRVNIIGSDIDTDVLEKAREGFYTPRAVKDVPSLYLSKYFIRKNGGYYVSDTIKKMVVFKKVNLISNIQMTQFKNMDFIFCRNVLIYFDDCSRKKVLNFFYNAMGKKGIIFLGHSESVGRISAAFKLKRLKNGLVYMK